MGAELVLENRQAKGCEALWGINRQKRPCYQSSRRQEPYDSSGHGQECPCYLALAFLALCSTLADLKTWIALADHVNSAAATDNLTVRVPELQRADR